MANDPQNLRELLQNQVETQEAFRRINEMNKDSAKLVRAEWVGLKNGHAVVKDPNGEEVVAHQWSSKPVRKGQQCWLRQTSGTRVVYW